jgi:hypothetical protein
MLNYKHEVLVERGREYESKEPGGFQPAHSEVFYVALILYVCHNVYDHCYANY